MKIIIALALLALGASAHAGDYKPGNYLVKLKNNSSTQILQSQVNTFVHTLNNMGADFKSISGTPWVEVQVSKDSKGDLKLLNSLPGVEYIQPNYILKPATQFNLGTEEMRANIVKALSQNRKNPRIQGWFSGSEDNKEFPAFVTQGASSPDPLFSNQWGAQSLGILNDVGLQPAQEIVVAVIDTGVDYTHEDLVENLWVNQGEVGFDANGQDLSNNGIDDDGNGHIDDVLGWDFADNDNKPFDVTTAKIQLLIGGGNPGHGTHCAGVVAARGYNGVGIRGVAPYAKIMSMRFIGTNGQGTTASAVSSIRYAVENGAQILSNSWGGPMDPTAPENKVLEEAIEFARDQGVLFIVASGNGKPDQSKGTNVGYDNDTAGKETIYPSSYTTDNIISVAAIDVQDQLGVFSNYGLNSVHIGAPGVKVLSTVPENKYEDTVIDLSFLEPILKQKIIATWDGTSMATPHVAGAAALFWSQNPHLNWMDVRDYILNSAQPIPALNGKVSTGGKLDISTF